MISSFLVEIILIVLYSILFLWWVSRSSLFEGSVLSKKTIVGLAAFKLLMGMLYYYVVITQPGFYDTKRFINDANIVYSSLNESVLYYLQLVFGRNDILPEPEHLCPYIDPMGFWYDQGNYTMVRINAFFRLFSFGFSGLHHLFFALLSFVGAYFLYLFFEKNTKVPEIYLLAIIFFLPGTAFWTSGGHKEAVVLLCIGVIFYTLGRIVDGEKTLKLIASFLFFMLLLTMIRFYTTAVLLPGLAAYYLSFNYRKLRPLHWFILLYGIFTVTAVLFDINSNGYRFAEEITQKQKGFLNSDGNTMFDLPSVSNSWSNIIELIPHAVVNPYIRPLIWDCHQFICTLGAVESIFLCVMFLLLLLKIKRSSIINNPVVLLPLFFGIFIMLLIGIIVNNAGAIVRYRSVAVALITFGLVISSYSLGVNKKNKS